MALISMKRKPPEMKMADPMESEYGYGLCLKLEPDQVEALGITQLPAVGTAMMIRARVVVKKTETEDEGEGPEHELYLQVTDLELGRAESDKPAATMLYGE